LLLLRPLRRMRLLPEETLRLTIILVLGAILGIGLGIGLPAAMGTTDDYSTPSVSSILHLDRWHKSDKKNNAGLRLEPARLIDHF